jgi:Immunity protein 8
MTAILKSLRTFKGVALANFAPDTAKNFHLLIDMTIGPDDQDGGHEYSVGVCTPCWLAHNLQKAGASWGRHLLFVMEFDAVQILEAIEGIIAKCERQTWAETSVVLARFFAWEFEDYSK